MWHVCLWFTCSGEHVSGERLLPDELPELCQLPSEGFCADQQQSHRGWRWRGDSHIWSLVTLLHTRTDKQCFQGPVKCSTDTCLPPDNTLKFVMTVYVLLRLVQLRSKPKSCSIQWCVRPCCASSFVAIVWPRCFSCYMSMPRCIKKC